MKTSWKSRVKQVGTVAASFALASNLMAVQSYASQGPSSSDVQVTVLNDAAQPVAGVRI